MVAEEVARDTQELNVTGKISTKEKIGYGIGDIAANFVWGMVTSYLLFFYTDIFGITAAAAGTLFLITRIWDAVNDPLMGIIIDKTKSKHGKTRPYILYLPIPLAIISVLTFITPDFSDGGKLVYAYITYTLLGMAFTAINLPFAALMPRMTRDSGEKGELNSYRGMGRTIATIIVAAFTLPLAKALGGGDQQIGFPITMGIYSVAATILYFVTFKSCHERVIPKEKSRHVPLRIALKNMLKNKNWGIVSVSATLWFLRSGAMNAALIYYVNYYLEQPGMAPFYLTLLNVANLVGTVLAFFVLRRWGSRNSSILFYGIATVLFIFLYLFGSDSMILFSVLFFIANVLIGFGDPANLTMLGDSIDYHEWRFGSRLEGLLTSSYSFSLKVGVAIGSSVVGFALALAGYDPDAVTEQAKDMMRLLTFGIPVIISLLQVILLAFYKLDKYHHTIMQQLEKE